MRTTRTDAADDPTPVAVAVEACGHAPGQFRWHLTDAAGTTIRVSPEPYASRAAAAEAGAAALARFGAAADR